MTIGFRNYDSSFFQIQIQGIKRTSLKQDISDRIISLEIVEELGKVITGNIQIADYDDMRFTNSLKGKRITVKWGYADMDKSGQMAFRKQGNPNELFSATLVNRYASGILMNPSGAGDENGAFTLNLQFYGREYQDKTLGKPSKYSSGKKGDVIADVFQRMGIDSYYIDFKRQNEVLTSKTAINQTESDFRFLARYAQEWRAMFRIAASPNIVNPTADPPEYAMVGLFCDYDKDASVKAFLKETMGASGDSSTFEYKLTGSPNVKSYSWQHHQGAGSGDNVRVQVVNGKTEFFYMKADTEEVIYYKLNTARMQSELASKKDLKSQTEWMTKMFDEANKGMGNLIQGPNPYFMPVKEHTAPQGIGLSATMEVIGNPLFTCPARAKFSKGFPDVFLTAKGLTFYQTRVSHKINRSGYTCSIQVADSYTVSGGSMVG